MSKEIYRVTDRVMRAALIMAHCTETYDEVPAHFRSVKLVIDEERKIVTGSKFSGEHPEDDEFGWAKLPTEYSWESIFNEMVPEEDFLKDRGSYEGMQLIYRDTADGYYCVERLTYKSEYENIFISTLDVEAEAINLALTDAFVDVKTIFENSFSIKVEILTEDQIVALRS